MKAFFLLLLSSICLIAYSQKSNYFDFNIGIALPLGEFQDTDLDREESGFAQVGRKLQLSYARSMGKDFWIILSYREFDNNMDGDKVLTDFRNQNPGVEIISIHNRSWSSNAILIGLSKQFHFVESRFTFEPKLQFGLAQTKRPNFAFSYNINQTAVLPPGETTAEDQNFAISLGFNQAYSINEYVSLTLAFDYYYTLANFSFVRYPSVGRYDPTVSEDISYTQQIQILSISGGLRFFF